MSVELDEIEKDIIECLARGWDKGEMGLYGHISYRAVYDFLKKVGADIPEELDFMMKNNRPSFVTEKQIGSILNSEGEA